MQMTLNQNNFQMAEIDKMKPPELLTARKTPEDPSKSDDDVLEILEDLEMYAEDLNSDFLTTIPLDPEHQKKKSKKKKGTLRKIHELFSIICYTCKLHKWFNCRCRKGHLDLAELAPRAPNRKPDFLTLVMNNFMASILDSTRQNKFTNNSSIPDFWKNLGITNQVFTNFMARFGPENIYNSVPGILFSDTVNCAHINKPDLSIPENRYTHEPDSGIPKFVYSSNSRAKLKSPPFLCGPENIIRGVPDLGIPEIMHGEMPNVTYKTTSILDGPENQMKRVPDSGTPEIMHAEMPNVTYKSTPILGGPESKIKRVPDSGTPEIDQAAKFGAISKTTRHLGVPNTNQVGHTTNQVVPDFRPNYVPGVDLVIKNVAREIIRMSQIQVSTPAMQDLIVPKIPQLSRILVKNQGDSGREQAEARGGKRKRSRRGRLRN